MRVKIKVFKRQELWKIDGLFTNFELAILQLTLVY